VTTGPAASATESRVHGRDNGPVADRRHGSQSIRGRDRRRTSWARSTTSATTRCVTHLDAMTSLARPPDVAVKACGWPDHSSELHDDRNFRRRLREAIGALGSERIFWDADLPRLRFRYREAVTMVTEEADVSLDQDRVWTASVRRFTSGNGRQRTRADPRPTGWVNGSLASGSDRVVGAVRWAVVSRRAPPHPAGVTLASFSMLCPVRCAVPVTGHRRRRGHPVPGRSPGSPPARGVRGDAPPYRRASDPFGGTQIHRTGRAAGRNERDGE
jgi:hypothetical protein